MVQAPPEPELPPVPVPEPPSVVQLTCAGAEPEKAVAIVPDEPPAL